MTIPWLNRLKQVTQKAGNVIAGRKVATMRGRAPRDEPANGEWLTPPVDALENESELLLLADIPGASPENTTVYVDESHVSFQARIDDAERWFREFRLPRSVDATQAHSNIHQGVLSIHIPKREPRRIAVRVVE
jgi:HSP20 family molecular chaperone IbpA